MHQSTCTQCAHSIGTEELRTSESAACPNCGCKSFKMEFYSKVTLRPNGAMTVKQRDPDKPGDPKSGGYGKPSFEHIVGPERSASGKLVVKNRIIDKQSDSYFERVTDLETGAVLHECEEPLSKHRSRGSAKEKGSK